jgi:hypothetical protein
MSVRKRDVLTNVHAYNRRIFIYHFRNPTSNTATNELWRRQSEQHRENEYEGSRACLTPILSAVSF